MKMLHILNRIAVINLFIISAVILWISYNKVQSENNNQVTASQVSVTITPTSNITRSEVSNDFESNVQNATPVVDSATIIDTAPEPTPETTVEPTVVQEVSKASQVPQHNTASDCWMIIDGSVYDISAYFGAHPGGDPNLLRGCGTDASVAYHSQGKSTPQDHSANAFAILQQFKVE